MMTIADAIAVNKVLRYLLALDGGEPAVAPELALTAAVHLVARARESLTAGLTAAEIAAAWPMPRAGTGTGTGTGTRAPGPADGRTPAMRPDRRIRHRGTRCPGCKAWLDATAHPTLDLLPRPGDATLCAYCGAWLVFEPGWSLRLATDREIAAYRAADPDGADQAQQARVRDSHLYPRRDT